MRVKYYDNPNWGPLEKLIGPICVEFMWMGREGDVEFYKHIDTRRYLRLNNQGLCFREGPNGLEPADLDEELKRVFEYEAYRMKRFVVGTVLWLGIVAAVTVIGLRWPVVFWLLVLSACLYLVFGRRANVELRMGMGHCERERRLYAAVVWKSPAKAKSENAVLDSEFDAEKAEEQV